MPSPNPTKIRIPSELVAQIECAALTEQRSPHNLMVIMIDEAFARRKSGNCTALPTQPSAPSGPNTALFKSIRLSPEVVDELTELASRDRRTFNNLIVLMLREGIGSRSLKVAR